MAATSIQTTKTSRASMRATSVFLVLLMLFVLLLVMLVREIVGAYSTSDHAAHGTKNASSHFVSNKGAASTAEQG